jgi:ABC-type uncharacterized transport system ATPase subunit
MEDLSFKLPPAGIVGVIGPNGAGKTTLFRMITGQEKPDAGSLRIGDTWPARRSEPRHAAARQNVGKRSRAPTRSSRQAA